MTGPADGDRPRVADLGWDLAQQQLTELAAKATAMGGQIAVVATDLVGGRRASIAQDEVFTSASLIKLPVMVTVLQQAEAATLPLSRRLAVQPAARVGGAGILTELADVAAVSVRDLLTLMIIISDNMATNVLIDAVGMAAVNAAIAGAALPHTELRRTLMNTSAAGRGLENRTSASDMARLLELIATGRGLFATEEPYRRARAVLGRQQVNDLLPRYLPAGASLAHKTGTLDGIRHDAGIVSVDGLPVLVIAALTQGFRESAAGCDASDLVAESGRIVYAAAGLPR
ncbi:MAG: serine hydrolase [Nakamurella sp.]